MESFILKGISVSKDTMVLEGVKNNSTILLFNKYSQFKLELEDKAINLAKFIEQNEICIQEESIFTLAVQGKDSVHNFSIDTVNQCCTLYKNVEVNTNKYTYILNILVVEGNKIQLHLKRIADGNAHIKIHNLHIHNNLLTFTVEKLGTRFIDEIGVILTNNNGSIQGITCSNSKGNKGTFEINLKDLSKLENTVYATNLVLDEQILPLKFNEEFNLNNSLFEKNDTTCVVSVGLDEYNSLIITTSDKIDINPTATSVNHANNKLTIEGILNNNCIYSQYADYKTMIKLISCDGSKNIQDEISVKNGVFSYEITDTELLEIKDTDHNKWTVNVCVYRRDVEVCCKPITCKPDFNALAQTVSEEEFAASLDLFKDEENKLCLKVKGDLTIEQILSIKKSGKKFIVKYRTVERVDKLANSGNLKTNLFVGDTLFESKKLKLKGKKTYICTYKTKDVNGIFDTILEKGLTIISDIQGTKVSQTMPEINEMVMYRSQLQWLQNTKKYKKLTASAYKKVFLRLPVNQKKVMFESFLGRNVSGNPKYIYEYMRKQGLDNQFKLVWILNDLNEEIPGKHKKVKRKSLMYYYHMATSGYWIFNARQGDEIVKRKETKYLQTWHGTPLKRLASDMTNVDMGGTTNLNEYKLKFFKNTRRWDYLLTQNDYSKDIFKRAFNFDKTFIPGYPANDILYTSNNKKDILKIKNKLGIPTDKKVIMYAPTWREDNFFKKGQYKLELELELDKMQEELGDEYVVLIRAHYLIANSLNISKYNGFVFDFSKGFDIQELYLVTDVMITDYSSVMFDYANLKRPMIFYMYDLEKYRDNLRGFYFDFEETAPGPIHKTTEGVINSIKNIDAINEQYKERQEDFYNKFCHIDNGKSARTAVNALFFGK